MKKAITLFIILAVCGGLWTAYSEELKSLDFKGIYDDLADRVSSVRESETTDKALKKIRDSYDSLSGTISEQLESSEAEGQRNEVPKPDLKAPQEQPFSVSNIEIGDSKADVEQAAGKSQRKTLNEYGVKWHAYHDAYQNFFMAAYDSSGEVAALYTNQDLISSSSGIKWGTPKGEVTKKLGTAEKGIRKGRTIYQMEQTGESGLYKLQGSYITIFYDEHEANTVTSILIVSEELEKEKAGFYAAPAPGLREGFELQLFDLTNAARASRGLTVLKWDPEVQKTALSHSKDMAENNYFNHTNLKGESPFDRMEDDQIHFRTAGENLASGQLNSIYAHEGLMNSLGHRKNILHKDFRQLGVGTAFGADNRPYFTENFLTR